ncbi:MAG: TetR/AcrR family transcriptional regulator [Halieaceae bacterium]|nr:TetR/AcrR family transcriptional regulator [Halieaceae bacterium]
MTAEGTPQRAYHHGNLRNELLDTAEAQLAEASIDELSLRALARRVGVSQTAPYRHFKDKDELLAALATRGYRNLLERLQQAADATGDDPAEEMRTFAHTYVGYAVEHPDLFKLMFGPTLQPQSRYPELVQASRETYELVRTIVKAGIRQGLFRDEDDHYLANAGWSGIHGLATLKVDMPQLFERHVDLERQIDLEVRIYLAGIRAS